MGRYVAQFPIERHAVSLGQCYSENVKSAAKAINYETCFGVDAAGRLCHNLNVVSVLSSVRIKISAEGIRALLFPGGYPPADSSYLGYGPFDCCLSV